MRYNTEYWASSVQESFESGQLWTQLDDYLAFIDQSWQRLTPIQNLKKTPGNGVIVCSVFKNEKCRADFFLDHYRLLGVKHFVIVDNASTDGTHEFLKNQPDVELYRTEDEFRNAVCGCVWLAAIIRKYYLDRWILQVDADELFVFDGMDHRDLNSLTAFLQSHGVMKLYAPMIDMYPDDNSPNEWKPHLELTDYAPYFDPESHKNRKYYWWNLRHTNLHLDGGPRNNNLLKIRRQNEPSAEFCLDKTPLILWDNRTCYPVVHYPWPPQRFNRMQIAVLLHFKFLPDFFDKVDENLESLQHWKDSIDYSCYKEYFKSHCPSDFKHQYSVQYNNPTDLVKHGLLQEIDWDSDTLQGRQISKQVSYISTVTNRIIHAFDKHLQQPMLSLGLLTQIGLNTPWEPPAPLSNQDDIDRRSRQDFVAQSAVSVADLDLLKSGPPTHPAAPDLYCVVYNELVRLPIFLEHYRSLGVRRFVFVDNNSSDGTVKYLQKQQDVQLYSTTKSYREANFGQCWIQGLVRREGLERWVLYVDADELLVYDDYENRTLPELIEILEHKGLDRLYSMMLDLYPEYLNLDIQKLSDLSNLYFDPWSYRIRKFYARRAERRGVALFGGPRARIFRWEADSPNPPVARVPAVTYLNKIPLMRWTVDTAYEMNHFPYPFKNNSGPVFGNLLHLKFLSDFKERAIEAISRQEHWGSAREHHSFLETLRSGRKLQLMQPWSTQYTGSHCLKQSDVLSGLDRGA